MIDEDDDDDDESDGDGDLLEEMKQADIAANAR